MNDEMVRGAIIVVVALVLLSILVFWSIRTINRIARKGCRTSRETLKELDDGR